MSRDKRTADSIAVGGLAVFLATLPWAWWTTRSCPIFDECGPWEATYGWQVAGWPALVAAALIGFTWWRLRDPTGRRAITGAVLLLLFVPVFSVWSSSTIVFFGEVRGPFAVSYIGVAALATTILALLVAAWLHVPRVEQQVTTG